MIIKIKQFIEKRLKQLFIKNEMNALSFKIENECFMDGSKSKTLAIYSPLKTVYLCIEKVYNTANILQIHGINVDTQKDIIDIKIFTKRTGILIGRGGRDIDKLTKEISLMFDKKVMIDIIEIKHDINAPCSTYSW